MRFHGTRHVLAPGAALTALLLLGALGAFAPESDATGARAENRYIGAARCKNCHEAQATGDQYGHWMKSAHARAFDVLASDEAKKVAKERGIDDPQKSADCVQCHVTAFGLGDEHIRKGFDTTKGVQCESCHGPGEEHMKARFAAASGEDDAEGFGDEAPAYVALPAGEIVTSPPKDLCTACHNEKSPTFKPFCHHRRLKEVRHLNPKKPRTAEELAALEACTCPPECVCKKEECAEK